MVEQLCKCAENHRNVHFERVDLWHVSYSSHTIFYIPNIAITTKESEEV